VLRGFGSFVNFEIRARGTRRRGLEICARWGGGCGVRSGSFVPFPEFVAGLPPLTTAAHFDAVQARPGVWTEGLEVYRGIFLCLEARDDEVVLEPYGPETPGASFGHDVDERNGFGGLGIVVLGVGCG